jgi:hypothetical protein
MEYHENKRRVPKNDSGGNIAGSGNGQLRRR